MRRTGDNGRLPPESGNETNGQQRSTGALHPLPRLCYDPRMTSRRGFVLLAASAGLGALAAPALLPRLVRALQPSAADLRDRLVQRLDALAGMLERGELDAASFVREVQMRLDDSELPTVLADRLAAARTGDAIEGVWSQRQGKQRRMLMLFFIAPGHSHPPHAHHDVASVQTVVRGSLQVRQYARESRLAPRTLALRPVADRTLGPGGVILTTERIDNVHWFGAVDQPAVVFNYSLNGGLRDLLEPTAERGPGRYFVDPTAAPVDGLIVAPHLGEDEAESRFAHHPLSDFPFPS